MVSKRKGTRLLERGELTGQAFLADDGTIVVPGGFVDFTIGPSDSSYSMNLRGIAIDHGMNSLQDPSQETLILVTRVIHGKDYRIVGAIVPRMHTSALDSIVKNIAHGQFDKDNCTLFNLPSLSSGQIADIGMDPVLFDAISDAPTLQGVIAGGGPVPVTTFISDDKGPALTVDDRLRIRMVTGVPTEGRMVIHVAVSTERPIQ